MSTEKVQILVTRALNHPLIEVFQNYIAVAKEKVLEVLATRKIANISIWPLLGATIVPYLTLVQFLRFRSLRKQAKDYSAYLQDPYKLDYKTAHPIMKRVMLYEAPWMYTFSTQFALLKTYAVAPGTGLLVQTRQLTAESTVGKRAEDTSVILSEFLIGSIDSERGSKAIAKMNWLHRRYGRKIKQPELLHTLSIFVLEPIKWFEKYEWRAMTELEQVAIFTYWKEVGNRMGIKDIPETLDKLKAWAEEYEEHNIYFSENNKKCAEATMGLFLRNFPVFMRGFIQHTAVVLCEDNIRVALGYEKPPPWIASLVTSTLQVRRILLRYFFLPRLHSLDPLPKPDSTGRIHRKTYSFEPWYIKATVKNWLEAFFLTKGKVLPGQKFKSNGYLVEEIGPVEFEKSSREPVINEAQEMRNYAAEKGAGAVPVGCPFKPIGYPFNYGA